MAIRGSTRYLLAFLGASLCLLLLFNARSPEPQSFASEPITPTKSSTEKANAKLDAFAATEATHGQQLDLQDGLAMIQKKPQQIEDNQDALAHINYNSLSSTLVPRATSSSPSLPKKTSKAMPLSSGRASPSGLPRTNLVETGIMKAEAKKDEMKKDQAHKTLSPEKQP